MAAANLLADEAHSRLQEEVHAKEAALERVAQLEAELATLRESNAHGEDKKRTWIEGAEADPRQCREQRDSARREAEGTCHVKQAAGAAMDEWAIARLQRE
jgi:hypothetical protein